MGNFESSLETDSVRADRWDDSESVEPFPKPALAAITLTRSGLAQRYIREILVPRMDDHRGRTEPASSRDILEKLYSVDPDKPGEMVELMMERDGARGVSVARALEIADIVYYQEQPGGRVWFYGEDSESLDPPEEVRLLAEKVFGLSLEEAWALCIAKYETRMAAGDSSRVERLRKEEAAVVGTLSAFGRC